ncbi:MAG: hypothetical protein GXY50_06065 [Syntrophomonadaceae bacterium]|nr:hypothetical protein [Syntrophomonadaceae bacterium]
MNLLQITPQVRGQERALSAINQVILRNEIAHAYLFLGPKGTGKVSTAMSWAALLLESERQEHPDLLVLERQKDTIGIGEVRRLIEWLTFKPYMAKRKVAVIPDAHCMSTEAANALLKALEEPAPDVVLLLTADLESLPATVISRCQVIRFRGLMPEELEELLAERGVEPELSREIAELSSSPQQALVMAEIDFAGVKEMAENLLRQLVEGDRLGAFELAERLEKDDIKREALLSILEVFMRDAIFFAKGLSEQMILLPVDLADKMAPVGVGGLASLLRLIGKTRRDLSRNANSVLNQANLYLNIADSLKEVV